MEPNQKTQFALILIEFGPQLRAIYGNCCDSGIWTLSILSTPGPGEDGMSESCYTALCDLVKLLQRKPFSAVTLSEKHLILCECFGSENIKIIHRPSAAT